MNRISNFRNFISKRLSSHGKGGYQLPGGHSEFGESFEECAQKELQEETNFKLVHVVNTILGEKDGGPKHYGTLFLRTIIQNDSTLKCMEPHQNSDWTWTKWEDLKTMNLFAPFRQAVENNDFDPFKDLIN